MVTKVYTSYFYQIRNFKPNMVPLSTAVWDPKWYHDNTGDKHYEFIDKNGVVNGKRFELFVPDFSCNGLCRGTDNCLTKDPTTCDFLKMYRRQLLMLDIHAILNMLDKLTKDVCDDPIPVLIVYETPAKLCSERGVIQSYLNEHGVPCEELSYPIGG